MAVFSNGGWLIHAAMAAYMAGLFVRSQRAPRAFPLLGTGYYIACYYLQPGAPPRDTIFVSLMIGVANLVGLLRLLHSRYVALSPAAGKPVFAAMPGLQPGEFHRLMRPGEIRTESRDIRLTCERATPDFLYLVTSGAPVADEYGVHIGASAPAAHDPAAPAPPSRSGAGRRGRLSCGP